MALYLDTARSTRNLDVCCQNSTPAETLFEFEQIWTITDEYLESVIMEENSAIRSSILCQVKDDPLPQISGSYVAQILETSDNYIPVENDNVSSAVRGCEYPYYPSDHSEDGGYQTSKRHLAISYHKAQMTTSMTTCINHGSDSTYSHFPLSQRCLGGKCRLDFLVQLRQSTVLYFVRKPATFRIFCGCRFAIKCYSSHQTFSDTWTIPVVAYIVFRIFWQYICYMPIYQDSRFKNPSTRIIS